MHRLLRRRVEARQREASLTGRALVVTLVVVLLLALGNVDSSQSAERPRRHHLKSQRRRLLPYPLRTADAQPEISSDFSFFYLTSGCTWNATKVSYQRLRAVYPESPVYILEDRGAGTKRRLLRFCKKAALCTLVTSRVRHGHEWQESRRISAGLNASTIAKLENFLAHIERAARHSRFLILMDPDVWVNRAIGSAEMPRADGGVTWNPWYREFSAPLQDYVANQPGARRMQHPRTIFGSGYLRSEALRDSVQRVLPHVDWRKLHALDSRVPLAYDTVFPILLALAGYNLEAWRGSCEKPHRYEFYFNASCSSAPLKHKDNPASKAYIDDKLSPCSKGLLPG